MIYFAHNLTTDLIKIGHSANAIQRIQQLRAKKNKVVLLGCLLGDVKRERQLHEWFFRFHETGEWFRPDPEIFAFIESHKIEDRLVVSESAEIIFQGDWNGHRLDRSMTNRLVALANERQIIYSALAIRILEEGIVRMESESNKDKLK